MPTICGAVRTGSDESAVWRHLHNEVPKMFKCSHCRDGYNVFMRGLHDMVNGALGKRMLYPADFKALLGGMQCVARNYKVQIDNKCPGRQKSKNGTCS